MAAASGEPALGLEALDRAVDAHERVGQPLELGRTLLVRGEIARRGKRKALARASLEGAQAIFDRLGAKLWLAKVEAELARVGGQAGVGELTPTERRIADQVVAGRTNREIAGALFISVKTVEANLSRIFHKLGVRSRTQLISSLTAPTRTANARGSERET
jgi:DNA-binding CsgD family transcriptional regulator